jgi:2-polyprenyl-3-methyl-5-hydroxy-6-metoxy-1,4-benzoquinol methylase
MNQNEFYERQINFGSKIKIDNDLALLIRDQFVIDYINNLLLRSNRQFKVAELSIGEGRLTLELLSKFPNLEINSFDISLSRIHYIENLVKSIESIKSNNLKLSQCNFDTQFSLIKSANYEIVIALDILEHVIDVFGFIENCRRILNLNGILILRVPNIAYIRHRLALLAGNLPVTASWFGKTNDLKAWRNQHGWDGGHFHLFNLPIIYQLLKDFNFKIEVCRDPGTKFEFFRNLAPNLLYSNPLIIARVNK